MRGVVAAAEFFPNEAALSHSAATTSAPRPFSRWPTRRPDNLRVLDP